MLRENLRRLLDGGLGRMLTAFRQKIVSVSKTAGYQVPQSSIRIFAARAETLDRFPGSKLFSDKSSQGRASLILTVKNEAKSIVAWLNSLLAQTRMPDEVVICDGGSLDGTLEVIQDWLTQHKEDLSTTKVTVFSFPGANIAEGRNRAVEVAARSEFIAFADCGCSLEPSWFENIVRPFYEVEKWEIDVVIGHYVVEPPPGVFNAVSKLIVPEFSAASLATFLPSARSMAVRRSTFDRVDGFPTFLTLAGEDTLFDLYLKAETKNWAFSPDASVSWSYPSSYWRLFTTIFRYAQGDGEAGLFVSHYSALLLRWLNFFGVFALSILFGIVAILLPGEHLVLWLLIGFLGVVSIYQIWRVIAPLTASLCSKASLGESWLASLLVCAAQGGGFVRGLACRAEVEKRRVSKGQRGHVVLLQEASNSNVARVLSPLERGLLDDGWYVTRILLFQEGGSCPSLDFIHPRIESYEVSKFAADIWVNKHSSIEQDRWVLMPVSDHPAFEPIRRELFSSSIPFQESQQSTIAGAIVGINSYVN